MTVIAENPYLEVHDGAPPCNGMYIAYVNDEHVPNYAKRIQLMWINKRWGYLGSDQRYRGHVYGWIGPLPALKLKGDAP